MDLIRLLLEAFESEEDSEALKKYDGKVQAYHIALLKDAGMVEASILKDHQGIVSAAVVTRLTWAGHEFMDSIRDKDIWARIKKDILKPSASWTVSIIAEYAKQEVRRRIGLLTNEKA